MTLSDRWFPIAFGIECSAEMRRPAEAPEAFVMERSEIRFGTTHIPFLIRRSDRRQTVSLEIDSGTLVVTAPARATVERLNDLVRGKALWVKQHIQTPSVPTGSAEREFVSGESLRYLGRQYRLKVVPGASNLEVKMDRGWLLVSVFQDPSSGPTPPRTRRADPVVPAPRRRASS